MIIAVTAASGKLGGAVIHALGHSAPEHTVVGLARTPDNAAGLGVEIRSGDYDDRSRLEASLVGVDALLLVSGNGPPDGRIQQHRNVIGAASDAGVSKVVYTSIQGAETGTAFSPIVHSNRQTERDVRDSTMNWVIGRNGIYVEPDIEYIDTYVETGEVANCAGDGRCGYTTYDDLADAYAQLLTDTKHDGNTYRLHGEPITQTQLVGHLNRMFGTELVYRDISVDDYRAERVGELGEFMGTVIAGIYEGIRNGALEVPSDYETAAGRPHRSWAEVFERS